MATVHDGVDSGDPIIDDQAGELARWQLLDFESDEEDDYVSDVRLAVVCGCGRSGTTLARVILDSHPALFAGPESLLFLPTRIDFADLAWKFDLDEASLRELFALSRSRTEFIDRFQELLRAEARKQIWVDKTARNIHRLDYIWRHFPNAKVIHVVRDPRDVVASLKTHRKHKVEQGKIVPTGFCMPVEQCIARWKLAMDHALPHRGAPNYLELKYEALVLDTEDTVRRLCDFIGVDFDRRMLDFHLFKTPTRDYLRFPQNVEATQPISTSPIGRHRMVLTADEIEQVEEETRSYMERLGYTLPQRLNTPVRVPFDPRAGEAPRIVTSHEVYEAIGGDPLLIKDWTREALRIHYEGKYIQPQKTYIVTTENPYDRIIALSAAALGDNPVLGIKWIGSHSANCQRGLERANAIIVLNDPVTHAARVVMDGTLISSVRTLAISLIAMDQFAPRPRSVGILGMGKLGRMHATLLGDLYPSIEQISCFSRRAVFDDLLSDPRIKKSASVGELLAQSEVVVTASAATTPYIRDQDLTESCRLIVNLSLMDCHAEVIGNSDHIVVDDWGQNMKAERVFRTGFDRGLYDRDRVDELSSVLFGPRRNYLGRVFVNPLGMGLEDVYVAGRIARRLGAYT